MANSGFDQSPAPAARAARSAARRSATQAFSPGNSRTRARPARTSAAPSERSVGERDVRVKTSVAIRSLAGHDEGHRLATRQAGRFRPGRLGQTGRAGAPRRLDRLDAGDMNHAAIGKAQRVAVDGFRHRHGRATLWRASIRRRAAILGARRRRDDNEREHATQPVPTAPRDHGGRITRAPCPAPRASPDAAPVLNGPAVTS